jgi:tetratricopeptide (TPR) repeat protein
MRLATPHTKSLKSPSNCASWARALIYNNLGNTLERLGWHAEALEALDKGILLDSSDPFPHYNRGIALLRLNRHREGIAALNLSLRLAPSGEVLGSRLNEADAHYNRGMARLLLGDFRGGWQDYEYRLLTSENKRPNLGLPADKKWNGEDIAGKRILLHAEQGHGDTIQFLRFLPELVARGACVLAIMPNSLKPVAAVIPGVTVLEPGIIANDAYDYWVALMSLPLVLGITDELKIPAPYWPSSADDRSAIMPPIAYPQAMRVGVVWAGSFQHKNDAHRSIPLDVFAGLFDAPCNFISLQQMRAQDTQRFLELKGLHPNLVALYFDDWRDTAAMIRRLDLVVSADTAVAHLAATLGVPTFILVPKQSTDWRWQLDRLDSPWYPAATLYRQDRIGEWAPVIARLTRDLTELARSKARPH